MNALGSRRRVAKRVLAAHAFGLCTAGIAGTIGTTKGFGIDGVGAALFVGGILSLPWLLVLGVVIWWQGHQLDRHPIAFTTIGPIVVVASWGLMTGAFFEKAVVISTVASSTFYLCTISAGLGLSLLRRMRTNHAGAPDFR